MDNSLPVAVNGSGKVEFAGWQIYPALAYHLLMGRRLPTSLLLLPLLALGACKSRPGAAARAKPDAGLAEVQVRVPHVKQQPGLGGEACLEMVLRRAGWALTQQDLFRLAMVDTSSASGCYVKKLAKILGAIGFGYELVMASGGGPGQARAQWQAVVADLRRDQPSLVCLRQRDEKNDLTVERFRLVVGQQAGQVVFHDPGREDGANRTMPLERFLLRWGGGEGPGRNLVRLRFLGGDPSSGRPGALAPTARLVHRMNTLRKQLPPAITLAAEPPFVVAGDEPPAVVRERARTTVRWATRRLKEAYGFSDPSRVIVVWLCRDRASYRRRSQLLFSAPPISPYGFFSGRRGVILLNASLGSGTVVHELLHAFTAASFPGVPTWFDEGLGSLYEACGERSGRIHGYINWRLPRLKQAIRADDLPSFRRLMAMSHDEFSNTSTSDLHYAQARFLCYYLQQKKKLRPYYRLFYANRKKDPTGLNTLQRLLKVRQMTAFQRRWENWVLKLRDGGGLDPDLRKP